MSVTEPKERHRAVTETVNSLWNRLKQRWIQLLDTDVAEYARALRRLVAAFADGSGLLQNSAMAYRKGVCPGLDSRKEPDRQRIPRWKIDCLECFDQSEDSCHKATLCMDDGHALLYTTVRLLPSVALIVSALLSTTIPPLTRMGTYPVARIQSGHRGYVSSCQYVPDEDSHLIPGSSDHSVSRSGSNSRMSASSSCDSTAWLWDTRVETRAVRTFQGHERDSNSDKFFPDGNIFWTGSDDGTCRQFDVRIGHRLQVYYQEHGHDEIPHVTSIAFSIAGRLIFAGYANGDCFV